MLLSVTTIQQTVRDEVLDAWAVDSIDQAYDEYPDREVNRLIEAATEFTEDLLGELEEIDQLKLLYSPQAWSAAVDTHLAVFPQAKTLGAWIEQYLLEEILDGL